MDNNTLNRYCDKKVLMKRDETKRNVTKVLPLVDEILRYVHSRDRRFLIQPLKVGSYNTQLKVEKADEFDYNVIVDVGKLVWGPGKTRYYGFNNTRDKVVEKKGYALPDPPVGQGFIEIGRLKQQWEADGMKSMTCEDDIVPIKVKRIFKALVGEAVNQPKYRNLITTDRISSSPATTLSVKFPDIHYPISIDLCPMIESQVEFRSEFHWPRPNSDWPSKQKRSTIKKIGVNDIAKEPFYWTYSFAACEKELLDGIDIKGTCRKKSQRIMKRLKDDVWCSPGMKSELTSYHLKNVLFWECEDHPFDTEWQQELMATRVKSMTYRLLVYIQRGIFPLYFHTGVNLLSNKDNVVLQKVANNIQAFLDQPKPYLSK
ncbi:protein mab-21-like 3 [Mizuhopecten yessoensis]|uniref:Protein mab-21-like 3 n=1 Tax=Mizuhopecten yessoensis TaxID=6573 RepID=A0A210PPJ9_MIZYE|nr:protein mab-21-like 3 [Mizuhopecten yessoensis]OWF38397.1 Protein mab-21-like 3 [Mizuhopecten yessoensis]